jgi:hypothetical protein
MFLPDAASASVVYPVRVEGFLLGEEKRNGNWMLYERGKYEGISL